MGDIQNKAEEFGGKAKEAAGDVTNNEDFKNEGKGEQVVSQVKQGAEDLKDKASETLGKLTGDK